MVASFRCPSCFQCPVTAPAHSSFVLSPDGASKCPAFQQGCPFKATLTVEDVKQIISTIPATHVKDEGSYISDSFKDMVLRIHEAETDRGGAAAAASASKECPFKDSQPAGAFGKTFSDLLTMRTYHMSHAVDSLDPKKQEEKVMADEKEDNVVAADENIEVAPEIPGPPPLTRERSLSDSLKHGTKDSHKEAESVSFVKNFIKGEVTRENYAILAGNLYHVYKTMEDCMAFHGSDVLGPVYLPKKLNRASSLLSDWRYLTYQDDDDSDPAFPVATPTAVDYVNRIKEISGNEAKALIAHAYTRYMGDLSGGQILAKCAKKALGLPETGEGSSFYVFPEIKEGGVKFKKEYRKRLDCIPLTPQEMDVIVGEANVAFVLNMRMFEELDVFSGVKGSVVRPLKDALAWRHAWRNSPKEGGEVSGSSNAQECPFLVRKKATRNTEKKESGKCPWPFILLHDPKEAGKNWRTWAVIAIIVAVFLNKYM